MNRIIVQTIDMAYLTLQNENVAVIEEKINQGQVEELINHAKNEIFLIQEIIEQRPWENLLEKAPPHQWTWPAYK